MAKQPNPGSDEAVDLGCICPVLDNAHGVGMPYPDGFRFWVTDGCPLHCPVKEGGESNDGLVQR